MLTGEVPFTGDTPVEIAMKHLNDPPRPPSSRRPGSPPTSTASSSGRSRRARHDRYQSAEELDSDLARIEAGLPVAPETAEAATAVLAGAGAAPTQVLRRPEAPPANRREADRRRRTIPTDRAAAKAVVPALAASSCSSSPAPRSRASTCTSASRSGSRNRQPVAGAQRRRHQAGSWRCSRSRPRA